MAGEEIIIGGLKLDSSSIKRSREINNNGSKEYIVKFNNGTKVRYPEQTNKNAKIIFSRNDINLETYKLDLFLTGGTTLNTNIYNCMGLEIKTSAKNTDNVEVFDCTSCTIDTNDQNLGVTGHHDAVSFYGSSQNNTVIIDKYYDNCLSFDNKNIVQEK